MWKTKAINRELPPGAGKQRRQRREEGMAMLFLLPSLLGLVLLSLIPMLISLYISLTDWVYTDGLGNWNFVGFQNFINLWKDSWFQKSLWNTVIFTIVTVPLTIILALVIAALIDNFCADRTAGVVRIALYMPHICNIVATSTIWKTMYSTYGPFTNLMRALGWSDPPRFLVSYTWALPAIMLVVIWAKIGYSVFLYGAAMQSLPSDLYECASLDGANGFQKFRKLTIPLLANTTFFITIAAARQGVHTALIQARPVLGGNASSEIRIHISGADQSLKQPDYAEGGLLYELMLENKKNNEQFSYSVWDMVLFEKAKEEKNLEVFFNTVMYDCETKDDRIVSIYCVQETTEMRYQLYAPVFVDATGNGTLGYYAGAEYRKGSEPQSEFGELHAPQQPNNYRMGNSILLKAKDMGHPVKFTPPSFAKKLTEEQLAKRIHCVQMRDTINCDDSPNPEEYKRTSMTSSACVDYGYWWLELCGDGEDIITEYEAIRDDLIAYAYGIWDHIKNNKEGIHEHHAENYALEWVGALPGVRESRRLVGDYLLSETDILEHKIFEDAVCYGGWCVDLHAPHGLLDFNLLPSDCNFYDGVYTIPYRSYYSKNIKNLYMAGRDISTTRLGLASTRIIGCCAIGGEAVGIAAALCNKYACDPRELAPHVKELQQLILKEDGFLPGFKNEDEKDLALKAKITASSWEQGGEPEKVANGISRKLGEEQNGWVTKPGECLIMKWDETKEIREIRLTFESNFAYPIRVTMAPLRQAQQRNGVPEELVKDVKIELYREGKKTGEAFVKDNYQRLCSVGIGDVPADEIRVIPESTNGAEQAVIHEIRVYAK